jgi:hypothetical protein
LINGLRAGEGSEYPPLGKEEERVLNPEVAGLFCGKGYV